MIKKVYPNLRMLKGGSYREDDIGRFFRQAGEASLLQGDASTFSEAELEMQGFVRGNSQNGMRTTIKSVEEKFSVRPYGWYLAAIQCTLAKLLGRMKIEARSDGSLLEGDDIVAALKNTRGFGNVILEPTPEVPRKRFDETKKFFNAFFDRPAEAAEARALGGEIKNSVRGILDELELLRRQSAHYPFVSALDEPMRKLEAVLSEPYSYFFSEPFQDQIPGFLETKADVIDPMLRFLRGTHRDIYDRGEAFIDHQTPNFPYLQRDEVASLKAMLEAPDVYRGAHSKEIKAGVDKLEKEVDGDSRKPKRKAAGEKLTALKSQLEGLKEYEELPDDVRKAFQQTFELADQAIEESDLVPVIRDTLTRFKNEEFSRMLVRATAYPGQAGGGTGGPSPIEIVPLSSLSIGFDRPYLETQKDIERYLGAVEKALTKAIEDKKRVQI